jgi:hypothetical protein
MQDQCNTRAYSSFYKILLSNCYNAHYSLQLRLHINICLAFVPLFRLETAGTTDEYR